MAKRKDGLTGKFYMGTQLENNSFQLEAVIDGEVTRLQANGSVPADCLYDKRHSGLKLERVQETFPPTYIVGCNCGYTVGMKDVNEGFRYFDKFQ